jgi:hypothetical protein
MSARHRELVAAVIAFILLGSQVTRRFELARLPVPVSQLDPFPFHSFFGHLFTRVVFSLKKELDTGPGYSKSGLDGIS